jgi:hypothetical protein
MLTSAQGLNTPLPTLSPPQPFRARLSHTQTAPNFDSFVTTVPVSLSQAVQTEAIYRCVPDTGIHNDTHSGVPRWASRTSAEPGFKHLDTNGSQIRLDSHQTSRKMHIRKRSIQTRHRDTQICGDGHTHTHTHSWTDHESVPQTPRDAPRPRQARDTHTVRRTRPRQTLRPAHSTGARKSTHGDRDTAP